MSLAFKRDFIPLFSSPQLEGDHNVTRTSWASGSTPVATFTTAFAKMNRLTINRGENAGVSHRFFEYHDTSNRAKFFMLGNNNHDNISFYCKNGTSNTEVLQMRSNGEVHVPSLQLKGVAHWLNTVGTATHSPVLWESSEDPHQRFRHYLYFNDDTWADSATSWKWSISKREDILPDDQNNMSRNLAVLTQHAADPTQFIIAHEFAPDAFYTRLVHVTPMPNMFTMSDKQTNVNKTDYMSFKSARNWRLTAENAFNNVGSRSLIFQCDANPVRTYKDKMSTGLVLTPDNGTMLPVYHKNIEEKETALGDEALVGLYFNTNTEKLCFKHVNHITQTVYYKEFETMEKHTFTEIKAMGGITGAVADVYMDAGNIGEQIPSNVDEEELKDGPAIDESSTDQIGNS